MSLEYISRDVYPNLEVYNMSLEYISRDVYKSINPLCIYYRNLSLKNTNMHTLIDK